MSEYRSSPPELFLGKGVLKISSKFIGEQQCRSAFSIKLLWNFIEIALRHECSPVSLRHTVSEYLKTPLKDCFCEFLTD